MTERSRRIVEGMRFCQGEKVSCRDCPAIEDCLGKQGSGMSAVLKMALEVIDEQEQLLKEYRVILYKATVAALKGAGDGEREEDDDDGAAAEIH